MSRTSVSGRRQGSVCAGHAAW